VSSSVPTNVTWIVSGVDLHGFQAFKQEVPNPWIVWDILSPYDSGVSKERCDINSTQIIWVKIHYSYDSRVFDNSTGSLEISGEPATWSSQNGYWMINVSERTIGQSNYTTPSSFEDDQHQASIIWDMVNLTITARDVRTNVGSKTSLNVNGTYAFDSTVWNGTVTFNDTLTKNEVGKFFYSITSMSDPFYGLSIFVSNAVSAIFDRVILNASAMNSRINVGELAHVAAGGIYQYDSSIWNGDFTLNDTLEKNEVGRYEFTVTSFTDPNYDLTAFESNSVSIIWDRVNLTLSCAQERVSVGSVAPIVWTGKYQYDQSRFQGNITLNENIVKNSVGLAQYAVTSISDSLYNLTVFATNDINIIFDELDCRVDIDASAIGKVRLEINVTYQFDKKPVTGANVTVENLQAREIGYGTYIAEVPEWKLYATYHTKIVKEALAKDLDTTALATGNTVVISLAVVIVVLAILVSFVFLKSRKPKIEKITENQSQMP
jgi:hypothetical protein